MEALQTLSERERAAILLFEIAGLSLEEVRHIQGEMSLSTIKSRLSRSRAKLRSYILAIENINHTKYNNHEK